MRIHCPPPHADGLAGRAEVGLGDPLQFLWSGDQALFLKGIQVFGCPKGLPLYTWSLMLFATRPTSTDRAVGLFGRSAS